MSKPNLPPLPHLEGDDPANYFCDVVTVDRAMTYAREYAEEAVRQALAAQVPVAAENAAHVAGLEAAINILGALVDHQRLLLVEVEGVCGRDGHGGPLEDGESDLIDRVRQHLAATICQRCGGTGEADSGGTHPWGAPALIPCECTVSASGHKPAPMDTSSGHSVPVSREYTSAMGEAAQAYMDSFPFAHKLPAQFRWADLWTAMHGASQSIEAVRNEDVATLLNFTFEHFGKPFNACDLPGYVLAAMRRLERAAMAPPETRDG